MIKKQRKKGITLIALVVTIVVLLIIAGTTIAMLVGDNGLLSRAKEAKVNNEGSSAKEKLEIELIDLAVEKNTKSEYNENEYIDNKLEEKGMTVIDDIIIVDGWQFQIDRSVPKIILELGKGKENPNIQIEITPTLRADYVNATLGIKVTYDGEISEIRIKGSTEEIPTAVDGVYTINKTIEENGTYTVVVKDKEGNYKIGSIKITDIAEDMDIWNKADMEKFRDMVNSGRTFEGKTARVMADIDLEGSESNQWIPIKTFKGTFEGNGHTINNIYINSTSERQGLFGQNSGTIKNIIITGNIKSTATYTAGIAALNYGKISECVNKATITGNERIGGISGDGSGEIYKCINEGVINGTTHTGGIAGVCWTNGKVNDCINNGTVTGYNYTGGIIGSFAGTMEKCSNNKKVYGKNDYTGGITGNNQNTISKCSNTAEVEGLNTYTGGIAGYSKSTISLSFNIGDITCPTLSGGIVGLSDGGTISNSYNRGVVKGNQSVGGVGGELRSGAKISYTYNTGNVSRINSVTKYAYGGVAGQLLAGTTCEYSYNKGNVLGNHNIGGIVGENRGNVNYCYNTGTYSPSTTYLGPITGYNGGKVTNCQSSGTMPTIYSIMSKNNNTNWVNNTNSTINGGYPILKWQEENK